jgi:presenilin-like A22 family membrane protease
MLAYRGSFRDIVVFYVLTLAVAAFLAYPYILSGGPTSPQGNNAVMAGMFFLEILGATAVFLIIIKLWPWLFRYVVLGLEITFLFFSVFLLFADISTILAFTLATLTVVARIVYGDMDIVQNISTTIIVGVAVAIIAAGFSPIVNVLILVILAVYDYVSVFVTKHMVTLAKAVAGTENIGKGEKHLLGAGDVAIPGIVAISLARASLLSSILACIGAVLGLIATTWLAKRWKRVLPALPSIGFVELLLATVGLII